MTTETQPETADGQIQPKTVNAGQKRSKPVKQPTEDQLAAAAAMEDDVAKRPVIVKLARIMGSLPELKPEGRNQHFGYGFIKDTQVSGALRGRLAAERLMVIPDVVEETMVEIPTQKGRSFLTKLKINFTVIDGDSGDSVSGHGFGYGDDSGDKGANKAFTAALKYWLLKLFEIGGEDLESDQRADLRAAQREAGSPLANEQPVKIESANPEGVQRGGKQDTISKAQLNQLFALYKDLKLDPEGLASRFETFLGIPFKLDPEGDATQQLNQAVKALSGEDAGTFISKLVDEKDGATDDQPSDGE